MSHLLLGSWYRSGVVQLRAETIASKIDQLVSSFLSLQQVIREQIGFPTRIAC